MDVLTEKAATVLSHPQVIPCSRDMPISAYCGDNNTFDISNRRILYPGLRGADSACYPRQGERQP